MVSLIVCLVSVRVVIDPCVKFGTTGTALDCPEDITISATAAKRGATTITLTPFWIWKTITKTLHHSNTDTSDTNCPIADVPAPPAVMLTAPVVSIVPARVPAEPAAVDVRSPKGATAPVLTLPGKASP